MVAALLLVVLVAWLTSRPEAAVAPEPVVAEAPADTPSEARPLRAAAVVQDAEDPESDTVERPERGAESNFQRRLAEVKGELYVYCFVGEEFSEDKGRIENGWFSMRTDEWKGSTTIGPRTMDAQMVVHWEAPEDATETQCTPERPTYGYVTVHVQTASGEPLSGAALNGCGTLNETGTDGMVEIPVLVQKRRCDMEVIRGGEIHYHGYVRVLPLQENESRTLYVTVGSVERVEGEPIPAFDLPWLDEQDDVPVTGTLPLYVNDVEPQGLEDYTDRLQGSEAFAEALQEVLALTPDDERWVVEEAIERNAEWTEDFRERVAALRAEAEVDAAP